MNITKTLLLLVSLASLMLLTQCANVAPSVQPNPEQSGTGGTGIGTAAPDLLNTYPSHLDTDIPIDTSIVLIFSEPVDIGTIPANVTISGGVSYSAASSSDGRVIILTITSGNLTPLTPYTIDIGTGILDLDTPQRNLITNYSISFTTSANTSTFEHPQVIAASRIPADGATGVSIHQNYVDVTFTKPVNPTTVNTLSFTIAPGSASAVSTIDNQTFRLVLNTPLSYGTVHTITLTADIQDSSGNSLVLDDNHTWSFTTEPEPATGALEIRNVWVINITDTSADIYWTTSTAQSAINVEYGATSAYGSSVDEPAGSRTVHQVPITGLTKATKYYFRIQYGTVIATGSFITADNTATTDDEVLTDTTGDKSLVTIAQNQTITSSPPYYVRDGSSFIAWKDSDNTIYASFINNDSTPTKLWGSDGSAVDSNNRTVLGLFPDFMGYCFVALGDGTNIYLKRIYNNAGALAFDSIFGANAAATGLIISTGTNPAVTMLWDDQAINNVYAGFVTKVVPTPTDTVPHTTEMNIPWTNYFFDFDVDLSVVATGNHVIDGSYNHTTIDKTGQNYRHVIGTAASVVTPTENYRIADHNTTTNFIATDHIVNTATAGTQMQTTYTNSGNNAYTDHGDSLAGWGTNDLVSDGTSWGYLTANATEILLITNDADSGTSDSSSPPDNYLIRTNTSPVYQYSLVKNKDVPAYAYISNPIAPYETSLPINNDIFNSTYENYSIWNGTYCWTHVQDPPFDSFYAISFNPSGLISNGETVTLYKYIISGTADAPPTNALYDNGVDLSAVVANDIVVNLTTNTYSRVNDVAYSSSGALGLVGNIMSNNQFYWILRFLNPAEPILVLGQATSTSASKLISTSKSAGFVGIVKQGDLVYNITDNLYAVVTSVDDDDNNTLTLNKDIITENDYFILFASNEPLIETGTVTTAGNPFTDTLANFTSANGKVQVGDIVHNITANTSAYVTAVNSATQLTLNNNIMTTAGHRYVIIQPRVLVAYERAGDIYGKVIRVHDGSTYRPEFSICTAAGNQSNVQLITSGYTSINTGAIALYRSGAGPNYTYYAKRINGAGVVNPVDDPANGGLGVQITPANAILLSALSDDLGGMFILYKITNDVYVRRITSVLGIAWTNTINGVVDAATCRSGNGLIVTYNKTTNSSQIFAQGYTSAGGVTFAETTIVALTPWAYASGLTIVPDDSDGAIISWIDDRYLPQLGYVIMAQAINSSGARQWVADPGTDTDYDGILIGITNIWYKPYLALKAGFYNDSAAPYGGIFLWYDRRNNKQDIYYDVKNN